MIKRNNPGNIRSFIDANGNYSTPFVGELTPDIKPGKKSGFRVFDSLPSGYRALFKLLKSGYLNKGLNTIEKIFPVYAPSSDANNPGKYIDTVEKLTKIKRDTVLQNYQDLLPIVYAITFVEHGEKADEEAIRKGYDSINNPSLLIQEAIKQNLPGNAPGKKKIVLPLIIYGTILTGIYIYNNEKKQKFSFSR